MGSVKGTVCDIRGDVVQVRVARCEGCGTDCGKEGRSREEILYAHSADGTIRKGDTVLIEINPSFLWKGFCLLYVVPTLGFLAGVWLYLAVGPSGGIVPREWMALCAGLLCVTLLFLLARSYGRRHSFRHTATARKAD